MSEKTNIGWTDSTWNPLRAEGANRWACEMISPGCDFCYASTLNVRFGGRPYLKTGSGPRPIVRLAESSLLDPIRWQAPRMIFVCSMTDLFGEWVPDPWLDRIFGAMAAAPRHVFQVLTKRPSRMAAYLSDPAAPDRIAGAVRAIDHPKADRTVGPERWPIPNVWCGVSIELDRFAWRAESLKRSVPAAVRFISAEPLLGALPSLRLGPSVVCGACGALVDGPTPSCSCGADRPLVRPGIDWLIVGGESGGPAERRLVDPCPDPVRRPDCPACHGTGWAPKAAALDAVRDLRARAERTGTALFFKQWGGPRHDSGGDLVDGLSLQAFPRALESAAT